MTNHELLTIIGEVSEDYVLAADDNVIRPRFRWQTLAACAACAALIVAAYPAYRAFRFEKRAAADSASTLEDAPEASQAPVRHPGLHEYTLAGDGQCAITTEGSAKVPEGGDAVAGQGAPVPEPAQPFQGDGPAAGGTYADGGENAPAAGSLSSDAAAREEAVAQYDLNSLMKEIDRVFEELDCHIFSSYGVYPDNRIHLDFFEMPGDEVLAALAEIDPDNSAIYIQVFTGTQAVPTDGSAKGPAPAEPAMEGE